MKRGAKRWLWLGVACGVLGCGESTSPGVLSLRGGQSVAGAPECAVGGPACPTGTSCLSFTLDGATQVRCLEDTKVCSTLFECSGKTTCAILESYPGRVVCAGRCEGAHCDDSVSSGP